MRANKSLALGLVVLGLVISACGPVVSGTSTPIPYLPFNVRDGGKSKLLSAPPVLVLADQSVTVTCQGRPSSVRIMNDVGKVLFKIPVGSAIPMGDGWHASFPLFDGLSAYFKPGDSFRVNCFGLNGTDGSWMTFSVFYTWTQAEAAGYTRP